MPCDARVTSAPFDRTRLAAIATPVSLTAVRVESWVVRMRTPPTTTVSVLGAGDPAKRGSGRVSVTTDRPVRLPTNVLVRPLDPSEVAAGVAKPTIVLSAEAHTNESD
jgi:hypothetical protein